MGARVATSIQADKKLAGAVPRQMTANHFQEIEKFEANLWKIADNLRANSNLASNEYFMPIMGLIFLRHATNRFYEAEAAIEAYKKAGRMPDRPLVEADFTRRRALNLPESARFDVILKTPKGGNLGAALNAAMEGIEAALQDGSVDICFKWKIIDWFAKLAKFATKASHPNHPGMFTSGARDPRAVSKRNRHDCVRRPDQINF